jgi:hypothetical protein
VSKEGWAILTGWLVGIVVFAGSCLLTLAWSESEWHQDVAAAHVGWKLDEGHVVKLDSGPWVEQYYEAQKVTVSLPTVDGLGGVTTVALYGVQHVGNPVRVWVAPGQGVYIPDQPSNYQQPSPWHISPSGWFPAFSAVVCGIIEFILSICLGTWLYEAIHSWEPDPLRGRLGTR